MMVCNAFSRDVISAIRREYFQRDSDGGTRRSSGLRGRQPTGIQGECTSYIHEEFPEFSARVSVCVGVSGWWIALGRIIGSRTARKRRGTCDALVKSSFFVCVRRTQNNRPRDTKLHYQVLRKWSQT